MIQFQMCLIYGVSCLLPLELRYKVPQAPFDYNEVKNYITNLHKGLYKASSDYYIAEYKYSTNLSDANAEKLQTQLQIMRRCNVQFEKAVQNFIDGTINQTFSDKIWGMFRKLGFSRGSPNNSLNTTTAYETRNIVVAQMTQIFGEAKICPFHSMNHSTCTLSLTPEIEETLVQSRNYNELSYIWQEWRNLTGRKMRGLYIQMVSAFRDSNIDYGLEQRERYGMPSHEFVTVLDNIYHEILPMYEALFTYVRRKLKLIYPEMQNQSAIYAHLTGNMWAKYWYNLYEDVKPFPDAIEDDITSNLVAQNYTPTQMVELAEKQFSSIGLGKLPSSFWARSMLEKPTDGREVVCHPMASHLQTNQTDVVIQICTQIDENSLAAIYHELGHVYNFLHVYSTQPRLFRRLSSSKGISEAVGDAIILSANAPVYLKKVGLLRKVDPDPYKTEMNMLMKRLLNDLPRLPLMYLIDLYRWGLFNGSISTEHLNNAYWDMRFKYQGIIAPVKRTEGIDFDLGSKFHVAADYTTNRYLQSTVLSYQYHEALCRSFDNGTELFNCSVDGQQKAGEKFARLLKAGDSKPWQELLMDLTGTSQVSAKAMLKYYRRLYDWLDAENVKANDCYGWGYKWPQHLNLKTPRC